MISVKCGCDGPVSTLYLLIAGDLEETPSEVEENDHRLTYIHLTNDRLYDDIKKHCEKTSIAVPDKELWRKESPMFIVSSRVYKTADGRIHINTIKPLISNSELKFVHPNRGDVFFKMYKPTSPPGFGAGMGTRGVTGTKRMSTTNKAKVNITTCSCTRL